MNITQVVNYHTPKGNGNKIDFSAMPKGYKTPKMVNLKRLEARSTWMITTVKIIPNIT